VLVVFLNTCGNIVVLAMAVVSRVCIHSNDTGYYDANNNNLSRYKPHPISS
jgi:hypothetical protein